MASILLILVAVVNAIFLIYCYSIFRAFVSPLGQIPAPHWSCNISDLWILRARKNGVENRSLHAAHLKYGPVVRVGPNTLSVHGLEALRTVYLGGFQKARWYSVFDNYGIPSIFSTIPSKEHSLRKRAISNVYSKSYIQSSASLRAQSHTILYERFLPILKEAAEKQKLEGIDVVSLFMAATMDSISAYIFGISNSTNFLQDQVFRNHWLRLYLARHSHHFWPQELPRFTSFCKKLGIRLYPESVDRANAELADWNRAICATTSEKLTEPKGPAAPANKPEVLTAMYAGIDKEEATNGKDSLLYSTSISQRHTAVASEVLDHVLAGHETAGIALTYLSWHVSQSVELQEKLREELLTLDPPLRICQEATARPGLPDAKAVDNLPILHAVIMETLRLHAPIPGPQPRETPYPPCQIHGYKIPGGVRVAALAHTLHNDERVFPRPDVWDYTRWLQQENKEQLKEMNRYFWAFGSGGRMCIGSNFAMNEMKYLVAAIYTNFQTAITKDEGIEQSDGYSGRPTSNRLFLAFQSVALKGEADALVTI